MVAPATGSALYGLPAGSQATVPNLGRIIPYLGMFPNGNEKARIGQKTGQCSRAGSQKARPARAPRSNVTARRHPTM